MISNSIPVIGILGNYSTLSDTNTTERFFINKTYMEAVRLHGGIPLPLPCLDDIDQLRVCVDMCDAILLPGGIDVDPKFYGENPHQNLGTVQTDMDESAFKVLEIAFARKMPVFGICRGHQVLNVALGGSLYQDISSTYEKESMMHQQRAHTSLALHTVKVEKGTMLFDIFGEETVGVNTFHHQAVKALGKDLIVTAVAPDGIIEAFESKDRTILGVQWHPELMIHKHANMKKVFEYFIHTMAASYKKSK